jgi:sugar/nucleoside kinase (ribokinase family)
MPKPGETIHSSTFAVGFGGKGANQAVAAARLGCSTAMIGKIGTDGYGKQYKEHLQKEGIDTEHLETKGEHSGVALIVVNSIDGSNQIVINANANKFLDADSCAKAKNIFERSKVHIRMKILTCNPDPAHTLLDFSDTHMSTGNTNRCDNRSVENVQRPQHTQCCTSIGKLTRKRLQIAKHFLRE